MKIINESSDECELNMDELKKELVLENDFLTKLVDTIPPKLYFEHDIQEKITAETHFAVDKVVEAIKRKSFKSIELSNKNKHKRARLDPFSQKSVSQIHDELNKKKKKKKQKGTGVHDPSAALTRAANIEELQRRLQERIDMLQAQRKATHGDQETKKKQKNKLKKLKVKQKGNLLKAQKLVKPEKPPEKNKNEKSSEKPVFNKEGNFLYSKFDFSENGIEDTKKDEYSGKKTKVLLKKAEKKKEKLEKLKNMDPEKAELVVEKEKWKKVIQKSEGIKLKDDPKLLQKTLKKEEKKKKKNTKVWKQRTDETEKRKEARQEKRNKNIQKRKKEKRDRKLKLAKKKGRVIPNL